MPRSNPVIEQILSIEPKATVRRCDGTVIVCTLAVNTDGTLYLQPPKGEWLYEPPAEPMEGQEQFEDKGEPA